MKYKVAINIAVHSMPMVDIYIYILLTIVHIQCLSGSNRAYIENREPYYKSGYGDSFFKIYFRNYTVPIGTYSTGRMQAIN